MTISILGIDIAKNTFQLHLGASSQEMESPVNPGRFIETCGRCGGAVRVIACIEDQDIIDRILAHLRRKAQEAPARPLLAPPTRAPPATLSLFAGKGAR